jgi:vacuolar iron transporter family protein
MAGLVGGAVSMALGEYVSVSSQSDSQRALIEKERRELTEQPEAELAELAAIYEGKGLNPETARQSPKNSWTTMPSPRICPRS